MSSLEIQMKILESLSSRISYNNVAMSLTFVCLAYQGKGYIVFRFIIGYNSLRDFYRPLLSSK
jgi:hypothetical protein